MPHSTFSRHCGAALLLTSIALLAGCKEAAEQAPIEISEGHQPMVVQAQAAIGRGTVVFRVKDTETGQVCYVSDGHKAGGISCPVSQKQ